jgi:hypothetical protein
MANRLDLTKCHLSSVRRKAQSILDAVAGGTHPLTLGGCVIEEMLDTAISVPVGPFYRLLFTSESLKPVAFMTHEQYNKSLRRPIKQ